MRVILAAVLASVLLGIFFVLAIAMLIAAHMLASTLLVSMTAAAAPIRHHRGRPRRPQRPRRHRGSIVHCSRPVSTGAHPGHSMSAAPRRRCLKPRPPVSTRRRYR